MQTRFDVGDIVYVPMKVMRFNMMYGCKEVDYTLRPIWENNCSRDMDVGEHKIMNKEDITDGEAEDDGNS